jgi:hypothetical protein
MFESPEVTSKSLSNAPGVHERVNMTYLSYQLKLERAYIAGRSKTFSPNHLMLQPFSSAEVQLPLPIPESKSRDVVDARRSLELLVFVTTGTSYTTGTLSFTVRP